MLGRIVRFFMTPTSCAVTVAAPGGLGMTSRASARGEQRLGECCLEMLIGLLPVRCIVPGRKVAEYGAPP